MSSATSTEAAAAKLHVRGAREHNLRNIEVVLPRNALIVVTGVSGSGKSSLAFDTIYAEGQRRYVESLSAYARQFLELTQKPDVDAIEGLSPAISIEQKAASKNPRSTVGTVTEIYDYMRLLWARTGTPYSPYTGEPIESQTVSQMVDRVMAMPERTRLYLLAPIVRGRYGEYKKELAELQKRGFQRVKIDGAVYDLDNPPSLNKKKKHDIEVVVDRLVVREGIEKRLADSFETALQMGDELAFTEDAETSERTTFSAKFACPVSGFTLPEIEPRMFSFNNPFGACPACDGLGATLSVDPGLVVDETKSLRDGAIVPWAGSPSPFYTQTLDSLARHYGVSTKTPWSELPEQVRQAILYGSGEERIRLRYNDGLRNYEAHRTFEGIIPNLERRYRETDSDWVREEIGRFMASQPCDTCHGHRLKAEALCVKIRGEHIGTVAAKSIADLAAWFDGVLDTLRPQYQEIGRRIVREIRQRLRFLNDVGLGYLTLARPSATLSGGESQRIRLASQIGSGLTGVLYVLDEPSIGLHQCDNARLLRTLEQLRDLGNTVIVVEHDEAFIRSADYVVDMGPGAGVQGGNVVASGPPDSVMRAADSLTAQYLTGVRQITLPERRRRGAPGGERLCVIGAREHNLADISASFPLGTFTAVTGVSGSGKSSLVNDTLYRALARRIMGSRAAPGDHDRIDGVHHLDKVIDIDQSPIGRTPRSNPATYTGAFTPIREWFAGLPEAKARGYKAGRFSFNVKGGRCEACQGDGLIKIEMHFLPDVHVVCDECKGKRYNRETLEITFRGKSIADVLEMTVDEGVEFFHAVPAIRSKLETLQKVGLGYIKIGQPATTLSGGEAQRVKLARELSKRATGRTLYILDEPTTGLHYDDVRKLLHVLHALVDKGNTVIVIEHNLEVIKTADWLLDLGPEGGDQGGRIVAAGTPEDVAQVTASHTGRYLAHYLSSHHGDSRKRA